jgi:septal ring factor EnvC (AmiA/AmiB activator)
MSEVPSMSEASAVKALEAQVKNLKSEHAAVVEMLDSERRAHRDEVAELRQQAGKLRGLLREAWWYEAARLLDGLSDDPDIPF